MLKNIDVRGSDIPLSQLIPIKKRTVTEKALRKLRSSIMAVGIIEPLCICPCDDGYNILDGYLRYSLLLELGVETAPCMIYDTPDIYTMNRQVNHISPFQEARMLRKALEKVDENRIAEAFGMKSLKHRLDTSLAKHLHEDVIVAYDDGTISRRCAVEFSHVSSTRQKEILTIMFELENFNVDLVQAQVLKTPISERRLSQRKSPWKQNEENKRSIADQLQELEGEYDFYSGLYRQYVSDLTRVVIHIREMIQHSEVKDFLTANEPDIFSFFQELLDNECNYQERKRGNHEPQISKKIHHHFN